MVGNNNQEYVERKEIGWEYNNYYKNAGNIYSFLSQSTDHWLLKGVCLTAEPVILEGQDGAGVRWEAALGCCPSQLWQQGGEHDGQ